MNRGGLLKSSVWMLSRGGNYNYTNQAVVDLVCE